MYGIEKSLIRIRNTWPKPCQHFPLAQSFVHSGFFLQQKYIREDIKSIEKEYQDLTRQIIKDHNGRSFTKHSEILTHKCNTQSCSTSTQI